MQNVWYWRPAAGVEDTLTLEEQDDVERQAQEEGPMEPEEHFYSDTEEELLTGTDYMRFIINLCVKWSPEEFVNLSFIYSEPPAVQVAIEDLTVRPGQPATFSAIITGHPTPDIQWFKVLYKQNGNNAYWFYVMMETQ